MPSLRLSIHLRLRGSSQPDITLSAAKRSSANRCFSERGEESACNRESQCKAFTISYLPEATVGVSLGTRTLPIPVPIPCWGLFAASGAYQFCFFEACLVLFSSIRFLTARRRFGFWRQNVSQACSATAACFSRCRTFVAVLRRTEHPPIQNAAQGLPSGDTRQPRKDPNASTAGRPFPPRIAMAFTLQAASDEINAQH